MEPIITHVQYSEGDCTFTKKHTHKFYEIYYLIEGNRNYYTEDSEYDVKPGDFILIYPGMLHKTGGGSYKRLLLFVTPEFFPAELVPYVQKCFDKVLIRPPADYAPRAMELIENISRETSLNMPAARLMAQSYLSVLILDLFRFTESGTIIPAKKDNTANKILEVISYINKNYRENITVDGLAAMAFVSKSHFCHQFKKITNCSPIDFVNSVRLNSAKHLLESSSLPISQIAEATGFSSSNYFGDVFLKRFGISPRDYRRENLT